jgi:hypothetical protein
MNNKISWVTCSKCGAKCTNDHKFCTHFDYDENGNVVCEDCINKK